MSWFPGNLGADRKKVMWLAGILVVGVPLAFYLNSGDDSSRGPATAPATTQNPTPIPTLPAINRDAQKSDAALSASLQRKGGNRLIDEFHPSLKAKEGVDLNGVDPTLRLDLLAKLRNLPMEGGARSVFKEGVKPVPPPDPVIVKPSTVTTGPMPPAPPAREVTPTPPPPPPPTPIPLKFFGYASRGNVKRALFIDGDDVQIAAENETIRNRYKVIKIGVNSAIVEDISDKHQQTLPLEKEYGS